MKSLKDHASVILSRSSVGDRICSSVCILTAVGSLSSATLRLANASRENVATSTTSEENRPSEFSEPDTNTNQNNESKLSGKNKGEVLKINRVKGNDIKQWNQKFEIVSLVGTFSLDGKCHVHMSLSDADGNTIGGHVIDGIVFTTVEVVMGTIEGVDFSRVYDDSTGFSELVVKQLKFFDVQKRRKWFVLWGTTFALAAGFILGSGCRRRMS